MNKQSPKSKDKPKTKSPKQDKQIMYSEYGYINVDKQALDDKNTHISFSKNDKKDNKKLEGTISKTSLCDKITINLKTLYGSRRTHIISVNIRDKISTVIDKLVEDEFLSNEKTKWNPQYQYRIVTTNGLIKELNPAKTFIEEEIKNDFTLILANPNKLIFSEIMKHTGIYVSVFI
jgi:hypothetical protein